MSGGRLPPDATRSPDAGIVRLEHRRGVVERMEGVGEIVGIGCHHQRAILGGGAFDLFRELRDKLNELQLMRTPAVVEGGLGGQRASLLENAVGAHVRVLDVRSGVAFKGQRRVDIEDDVAADIHGQHRVGHGAQADLAGHLEALVIGHLGCAGELEGQHASNGLVHHILEQFHLAASGRHGAIR